MVSLLGELTNLYKVGSIIYMGAKIQEKRDGEKKEKKQKKQTNLLGEARAFKGTTRMPTIFKPPFLKKRFFFGLKYFTLNVNGRMSLIHCGHLCNVNPCPPFLKHGELQPSNYYNKCYSLKLKHILAILKLN